MYKHACLWSHPWQTLLHAVLWFSMFFFDMSNADSVLFRRQGYLDEQFCQVEDLQDEASPNFAEEVVTLFFKDSARLISNAEQAL